MPGNNLLGDCTTAAFYDYLGINSAQLDLTVSGTLTGPTRIIAGTASKVWPDRLPILDYIDVPADLIPDKYVCYNERCCPLYNALVTKWLGGSTPVSAVSGAMDGTITATCTPSGGSSPGESNFRLAMFADGTWDGTNGFRLALTVGFTLITVSTGPGFCGLGIADFTEAIYLTLDEIIDDSPHVITVMTHSGALTWTFTATFDA